jgi:rubrerythrin
MAVVGLIWIGFAIAFVFAQFKLFSIDRTLKQISRQLSAIAPAMQSSSEAVAQIPTVPKDVWACKNCGNTTSVDSGKPTKCGFCGAKDFEQKTIQVKANPV